MDWHHDSRLGRLVDGKYIVQSGTISSGFLDRAKIKWDVRISQNFERTLIFPSEGAQKGIQYNVFIHDNEGNTWVGSEDAGLFRIRRQSISRSRPHKVFPARTSIQ